MIAHSAQRIYGRVQVPAMSYPDLAEATLETGPFKSLRKYSKCFRYLVDFTICFNLFGSCCVYQIMMARTIKQLVEGTNEVTLGGNPPLRVYIICLVVPCVLIGMITTLKYLAPFSIVADFIICMSIVVSIVVTIGFFGYWGFGESSRSPVTLNFPLEPFPIALKLLLGIMIYVTFALNFWFPFDLMWYYIKRKYDPSKYWLWERVYRAIFICVITAIATTFPNVSKFIGVLGSFCISNMGFIYPAFIELCLDWTDPGLGFMMWRFWRFLLITAFGLTLCIVGTYTNVKGLIKESF